MSTTPMLDRLWRRKATVSVPGSCPVSSCGTPSVESSVRKLHTRLTPKWRDSYFETESLATKLFLNDTSHSPHMQRDARLKQNNNRLDHIAYCKGRQPATRVPNMALRRFYAAHHVNWESDNTRRQKMLLRNNDLIYTYIHTYTHII
jgi:hypothetical protein